MKRLLFAAVLAVLTSPALGQIKVEPKFAQYAPIVATLDLPANASALWDQVPNASVIELDGGKTLHIWAAPGKYQLSVIVIAIDWEKKTFELKRHQAAFLVDGQAPDPEPKPDPQPQPVPFPVAGLVVMVGVDRQNQGSLPQSQLNALISQEVRAALDAACVVGSDGKPSYRFYDAGQDVSLEPAPWPAAASVPRGDLPYPYWLLNNGKKWKLEKFPLTKDAALARIKEYK